LVLYRCDVSRGGRVRHALCGVFACRYSLQARFFSHFVHPILAVAWRVGCDERAHRRQTRRSCSPLLLLDVGVARVTEPFRTCRWAAPLLLSSAGSCPPPSLLSALHLCCCLPCPTLLHPLPVDDAAAYARMPACRTFRGGTHARTVWLTSVVHCFSICPSCWTAGETPSGLKGHLWFCMAWNGIALSDGRRPGTLPFDLPVVRTAAAEHALVDHHTTLLSCDNAWLFITTAHSADLLAADVLVPMYGCNIV